jgi:hypothetical protein
MLRGAWVFLLLAGVAGCGNGPKMHPVRGKVVYADGSPMRGGTVMFEPMDPAAQVIARGVIDTENGTFTLSTYREGDGAMEGRHRAMVRGRRNNPKSQALDPTLKDQIHPRFQSFQTSGLEFTVEPKKNEFVITVEKAPGPRG